ncbi:hypothetical protein GLOIN_2v1877439 [Rhizophagus clarus]|uniref:Uncharacterized protein n=1 Tax=Rhizophagus clarus TaxID=94130 RepID=A0A8H3L4N4_9GLOM|nr:hypothetical protein GLOIN_2v1877439 [Rhizophagus clarus]
MQPLKNIYPAKFWTFIIKSNTSRFNDPSCGTKIKFFEFRGRFDNQAIYKIFQLIANYLNIDIHEVNNDVEFDSILLQNLRQILPPKLEYLKLNRGQQQEQQEIEKFLPCIKEYIMKKKRTKYLAFRDCIYIYFPGDNLVYLKDKINDLNIDALDFVNKIISYGF